MTKFNKAMKVYLKGCKFLYFSYFVILLFTVFVSLLSTYGSKVLIDILTTQNKNGLTYNSPITMEMLVASNGANNIIEEWFINTFGGINFLSYNIWVFSFILLCFTLVNMLFLMTRLIMFCFFSSKCSHKLLPYLSFHRSPL